MTRRLSLLLVALLALGGLAAGPSVASAAPSAGGTTRGTIKVQLQTPKGVDWPKKGFVVTASGMKKDVYEESKTDATGVATLKVPPGKYTITVATFRSRYEWATVKQDFIAISRGQVKTIGMKMYYGAQITGKVMKPTGFALAKARVAAVKRNGVVIASTTSDKNGKYRLAGLPTGKYAIVFNERSYVDGKSKAANNYGWAFFKGSSLAKSRYLQVYQENKFADATKTTGISGPVSKGTALSVSLTEKNSSKGRLLVDHIAASGKYLQFGSVYAPFTGGTKAKVKVDSGKYRLGVVYAGKSYYYTGETVDPLTGTNLTTDVTKGLFVYFNGSPLSVSFGTIPR